MIFYSLQGLGNSVINFPILASLRRRHPVRVAAFENGSADFFRAFHDDVVGLSSNRDLLRFAYRAHAGEIFTCTPTWRREIAASLLSSAERKRWFKPSAAWARVLGAGPRPKPHIHDLENNLDLLAEGAGTELNLARILNLTPATPRRSLGVHPTASTPVKYYPRAFWTKLLSGLADEYDDIQIFCGGRAEEIAFCQNLHPGAVVHAGLPFTELVPRLNSLAQFIGSDSALMHIAAMLGRPTLGLWAYADYRRIYPYGDQAGIYIPRETRTATDFDAPATTPAYLARADADEVRAILHGARPASFSIARRAGPAVAGFEF